eukprot:gene22622-27306_t
MLSEGEYELTSLVPEDGKDNSEEGAAADVRELRNTRGVYHWNQLKTLLWKHLLFKMRSPAQTLGEIFSPVLLICVLVYAFSYTYVHHYDAEIYANQAVGKVVRKHVAEAEFIRAVAAELTFRLPLDATPLFPDLFRELEEEGAALGVASFGVSMTTLEDVFLHLGDEAAAAEAEDGKPLSLEAVELSEVAAGGRGAHPASVPAEEAVGEQEQERAALVEVELGLDAAEADGQLPRQHCGFFQSVELMLLKRALVASRDMKAMAHFVLLPVVVVSLVLMILHMDFSPAGPALTLN